MLAELRVVNLGVIADQTIVLDSGLWALTGETGAGKTLLVDAISLLLGGPPDASLVAPGAAQARVEGRFVDVGELVCELGLDGTDELVMARVVPAQGRSRAYVGGRMVSTAELAEIGRRLVDIHGQSSHQSLLSAAAQRRAFDRAAGVDEAAVAAARRRVRELERSLAELGGDPHERARRLDLLGYQRAEIDRAGLDDPGEDTRLGEEEELLADAAGLAEAATAAWMGLAGDDGVVERLGAVVALTAGRRPLSGLHDRLLAAQEELSDAASQARHHAEAVEADPERLAAIGERRRQLSELRRKYGPTLAEVISYGDRLRQEITELAGYEQRAASLGAELEAARAQLAAVLEAARARRATMAPRLSQAVQQELQNLAMPRSRFAVEVGEDPADESVTWLLAANPGQPLQPLAKVASGGELSRAMLAARLVMGPAGAGGSRPPGGQGGPPPGGPGPRGPAPGGPPPAAPGGDDGAGRSRAADGPPTLVFDEVDAGIGGEAAHAVGRALAALAGTHQVLVITHLAQVAAFAGGHLNVAKTVEVADDGTERTVATATPLSGQARLVELARMLSGRPDSPSALRHAEELLATAGEETAARRRR